MHLCLRAQGVVLSLQSHSEDLQPPARVFGNCPPQLVFRPLCRDSQRAVTAAQCRITTPDMATTAAMGPLGTRAKWQM